jgi:hypothetical protein
MKILGKSNGVMSRRTVNPGSTPGNSGSYEGRWFGKMASMFLLKMLIGEYVYVKIGSYVNRMG